MSYDNYTRVVVILVVLVVMVVVLVNGVCCSVRVIFAWRAASP